MVSGLNSSKMSASLPNSKVDMVDLPDLVRKKILSANCQDGIVEGNEILALVKELILPLSKPRVEDVEAAK